MAHKKNKIELRDRSYSLRNELSNYHDWFENYMMDYDHYDFCDYYCDCHLCVPDYKYLPQEKSDLVYRVGGRVRYLVNQPIIGRMIDMTTVYSKDALRQKRIDYFLGLDFDYKRPTIADIFNK